MTPRILRTCALGALAATMFSRPALAAPQAALRDTTTPYLGQRNTEFPDMLARVSALVDSGFDANDRRVVLSELSGIRPVRPRHHDDPWVKKTYLFGVRFRGHESRLLMTAYWWGTNHVAFQFLGTRDTTLLEAIDSTLIAARVATLSPPGRVRLGVGDSWAWNGALPRMGVGMHIDEAKHCPDFGLDSYSEEHEDTLAIHIEGAAPPNDCPGRFYPKSMTHGRSIVPGRYVVAVDYRGDTNRFAVQVTDSTLALSTIRSTFVTADERIRWRIPGRSVKLECYGVMSKFCIDANAWLARYPGMERVQFRGPATIYADTVSAPAYRYANEQVLARVQSCFRSIAPDLARSVELQIRPATGRWSAVRAADRNASGSTTWIDPACGFPSSIYDFGKSLAGNVVHVPATTTPR
jgi:hypothetical protein